MSRENAAAARADSTSTTVGFHRLLDRQLAAARSHDGSLDLDFLLQSLSAHYDSLDEERRGIVRSMQLMSDEALTLTREIREETASHLQAILDNVKDAIITVDDAGHIETVNPTVERIFGYAAVELLGRTLNFLLPDVHSRVEPLRQFLERSAATIDDTHIDLAAHQTWGAAKGKKRVAVEIAISKASLNRRNGYIVCIRDCTERQVAEQSMRESEARYRTLVEHAPEVIVVFDVDSERFVDINDNACSFFKMTRETLLSCGPARVSPRGRSGAARGFARAHIDGALAGEAPVFDWVLCDALGEHLPCEVRFVRLPSSSSRLVRASITDIAERKRSDAIAAGERRVFETIAANAPLSSVLEAICEVIERVMPNQYCAINLLDAERGALVDGAAPSLPREFLAAMDNAPIGLRFGCASAAVHLMHPVPADDIRTDALWECRREAAMHAGLRGAWSAPILASDGAVVGTVSVYRRQTGTPPARTRNWYRA